MIKTYRAKIFVQAVQFQNSYDSIQEVIGFVGLPVNVEYTSAGVQMRIIRNPYNVIIVKVGEYVTKAEDGTLGVISATDLAAKYDEVTA
ncbi:hypothetical protein ACFQ3W_23390 [Paenibacillus puldeungensis]|uniref:Phage protein n=1 Tax=Paenibacillus puldeungensis TaxID=696536 RepID=A0ABW3S4V4_9BACL